MLEFCVNPVTVFFCIFKMGFEYMTYILWRDVPLWILYCSPFLIFIFAFLIISIVRIVGYAIKICSDSYGVKYDQCVDKVFNMFGPRRAHAMARFIFRKILKRGEKDTADKPQTTLFGYIVTDNFIYHFLALFLYISVYAFVVFWDAFMIYESYSCNVHEPNLDCFSKTTRIRINCYNATVEQQVHIVCFKFSYTISLGLVKAGIVLLLSSIITVTMVWFLLRLSGGKSGSVKRRSCACFIQIFLYMISIVFLWFVYFISTTHSITISNFLYFVLPLVIIGSISSVHWRDFEKQETK